MNFKFLNSKRSKEIREEEKPQLWRKNPRLKNRDKRSKRGNLRSKIQD